MTVLVTGGAGFVGSHLCERLLADGERVVCIDNLATGRMSNIADLGGHPCFSFVQHDIVMPLPLLPPLSRIYHLASPASPPAYQRLPIETLRVNSEGTHRLLELAASSGARFLFASTSEIYGDPLEHPQREAYWGNVSSTGPRSMYDEAKRYGEALTTAYAADRGVDARIARIFNTYGPRMDPNDGRIVSNFIVQALSGAPLTVYGDGGQTRSFQYVDDLVEGLMRLMASSYRDPVNIGNPIELTVLEFAELIQRMTGVPRSITFCPLPGDDPKRRRPNISLANRVLGWEPQIPLEVGIARTINAFRMELDGGEEKQTDAVASISQSTDRTKTRRERDRER